MITSLLRILLTPRLLLFFSRLQRIHSLWLWTGIALPQIRHSQLSLFVPCLSQPVQFGDFPICGDSIS